VWLVPCFSNYDLICGELLISVFSITDSGFYKSHVLQIPPFTIACFTDSGFYNSGFYRFRLLQFHVLQISAFTIPIFKDSGFYNSGFYRFRLLQFRVFAFPIPVPIPFRNSPFCVLQVALVFPRQRL
jgi:hypothetical protein